MAIQACYLSSVAEKISIWKDVVRGLADSLEDYVVINDPNNETPTLTRVGHKLLVRDAIALSNVAEQDESSKWIEGEKSNPGRLMDFYLLALMRVGRFDLISQSEAKAYVKDLSQRLLILVETIEADLFRPLGTSQKRFAKELQTVAATGSKSLLNTVIREMEIHIQKAKLANQKLTQLTSPKASMDESPKPSFN
ncbi:MAG: hypothetical protein ACREXS_11070 [Gammaproteobacteria bacterium]